MYFFIFKIKLRVRSFEKIQAVLAKIHCIREKKAVLVEYRENAFFCGIKKRQKYTVFFHEYTVFRPFQYLTPHPNNKYRIEYRIFNNHNKMSKHQAK